MPTAERTKRCYSRQSGDNVKRYLILSGLLILICTAFVYPDADVWTGPVLGGEWIDGWYLHSDAEFDLVGDGCLTCHKEMTRTEWYCGDAWFSFYEF